MRTRVEESNQLVLDEHFNDRCSKRCKRCTYVFGFIILVFLSAFMGAFSHSYFFKDNIVVEESTSITSVFSKDDKHICRPWQDDQLVRRLQNSVAHLTDELNTIKHQINQDTKMEIINQPCKSAIEELLSEEPDLAAAGNFGRVLATPDTQTYMYPVQYSLVNNMFTFSLETPHKPPQTTIQGIIQEVWDCWAFTGERGRLVVALHQPSLLVRVSLSHIPPSMSVTGADSAPRHFLVLAHQSEEDLNHGLLLGEFEYIQEGPWRQVFTLNPLVVKDKLITLVEFRFLSNHGHPNFTCVYRVQVHGKMYIN